MLGCCLPHVGGGFRFVCFVLFCLFCFVGGRWDGGGWKTVIRRESEVGYGNVVLREREREGGGGG